MSRNCSGRSRAVIPMSSRSAGRAICRGSKNTSRLISTSLLELRSKMKSNGFSQLARRTGEPAISWLMRLTLEHPHIISLAAGFTDNKSLPVAEVERLLEQILGATKTGRASLQYGTTAGHPDLRRLTAHDLGLMDDHG